jgi:hypothetical protein
MPALLVALDDVFGCHNEGARKNFGRLFKRNPVRLFIAFGFGKVPREYRFHIFIIVYSTIRYVNAYNALNHAMPGDLMRYLESP